MIDEERVRMARKSKKSKKSKKTSFLIALRRLKKLKPNDRIKAMSMANNSFIRQLCQHLKKLKRAKLSPSNRKQLQKHKKQLRLLTSSRTGLSKRRRILTQSGGGILGAILRGIPVVGPLLSLLDK